MMGHRLFLVTLLVAFIASAFVSETLYAQTGSNPLERLSGPDYQGLLSQTTTQNSRAGLLASSDGGGTASSSAGQQSYTNLATSYATNYAENPFVYNYGGSTQASSLYNPVYSTPSTSTLGYGSSTYLGTPYGLNVGGGYGLGSSYYAGYNPGTNYAGGYGLTYGTNYVGGYYNGAAANYGYGTGAATTGVYSGVAYPGAYTSSSCGYSSMSSLLPGLVGGALGAMLGRNFGVLGLVAGGLGGFVLGAYLGDQASELPYAGLYDNYNSILDANWANQYTYQSGLTSYYLDRGCSSSSLGSVPGLVGAALGAVVGGNAGIAGMLIGGVVGFCGGQLLGEMLFPGNDYDQYGNYLVDPYNNLNNFRQASLPGSLSSCVTSGGSAVVTPYESISTSEDGASLSKLRTDYFNAMDSYQKALASGTDQEKEQSRLAFETAQSKYMTLKAKESSTTAH